MEKKVQRNFYGLPYWYWAPSGYRRHNQQVTHYQTDNGLIFGTIYKLTYQCDQNLKAENRSGTQTFRRFLYLHSKRQATITRINRNEDW